MNYIRLRKIFKQKCIATKFILALSSNYSLLKHNQIKNFFPAFKNNLKII